MYLAIERIRKGIIGSANKFNPEVKIRVQTQSAVAQSTGKRSFTTQWRKTAGRCTDYTDPHYKLDTIISIIWISYHRITPHSDTRPRPRIIGPGSLHRQFNPGRWRKCASFERAYPPAEYICTSYPKLDRYRAISASHRRQCLDPWSLPVYYNLRLPSGTMTGCTLVWCNWNRFSKFRMHTSHNVDVYLSISSNPIIEHCSDIRFAAYPSILLSSLDQVTVHSLKPNLSSLLTAFLKQASSHHSVQDFSHIRSTPSPHWSVLRDDRVTARWPLEGLQRREELDLVRENFLPK